MESKTFIVEAKSDAISYALFIPIKRPTKIMYDTRAITEN
jgi:hypothetical protein